MTISERERHILHLKLEELMGSDVASTMMSHLPPVGWADVATKHDLSELEGRLSDRLDAAVHELRAELYSEIGKLRSELHSEIGTLRSELHSEIGSVHSEIGAVRSELAAMTRTYLLGNIALVFTVAAVAFAAARLV